MNSAEIYSRDPLQMPPEAERSIQVLCGENFLRCRLADIVSRYERAKKIEHEGQNPLTTFEAGTLCFLTDPISCVLFFCLTCCACSKTPFDDGQHIQNQVSAWSSACSVRRCP